MTTITLRKWQAEALPKCLESLTNRTSGVVSAVMGAGKSVVIAQIAEQIPDDVTLVVTAPRVRLVRQLADTIGHVVGRANVGTWYQGEKRVERVTVSTLASIDSLAEQLRLRERRIWWVADEVHRTETDRIKTVIDSMTPEARIGFSATPYRAADSESLSLWDEEIYTYGPTDAMRDGVIVPYEIVPWTEGQATVDDAVVQMITQMRGSGRIEGPGLVNAESIEDAEEYAERLRAEHIAAEAIHSKMGYEDQELAIDRLRTGAIDALVHVAMLAEGVDMPWLRWMALRRPVRSRVRFVQEVGRGLRSYADKTKCTYLDPMGLFAAFSLTYEAALGWVVEDSTSQDSNPKQRAVTVQEAQERQRRQLESWGWSAEDAYLRQLALIVGPPEKIQAVGSQAWRLDTPSDGQREAIRRLRWAANLYPDTVATWLRDLIEAGGPWTRGGASDMITAMIAAADARRSGHPVMPDGIQLTEPPDFTEENRATGRVYLAQAWKSGIWAVAVVRGGRVIYTFAGEAGPDDSWGRVMRREIARAIERSGVSDAEILSDSWSGKHIPGQWTEVPPTDNAARSAAWRARKRFVAKQTKNVW